MINFLKLIAFLALSIIVSSTIFSLWIGLYWFIYEKLYGAYNLVDFWVLQIYVKKPFLYAIVPGVLLGIFQGLITGLLIKFSQTANIIYSGLFGFLTTIIVLLGAYFILGLLDDPNPLGLIIHLIFTVIYEFRLVLQGLLFFLFPSFLIGFLLIKLKNLLLG